MTDSTSQEGSSLANERWMKASSARGPPVQRREQYARAGEGNAEAWHPDDLASDRVPPHHNSNNNLQHCELEHCLVCNPTVEIPECNTKIRPPRPCAQTRGSPLRDACLWPRRGTRTNTNQCPDRSVSLASFILMLLRARLAPSTPDPESRSVGRRVAAKAPTIKSARAKAPEGEDAT